MRLLTKGVNLILENFYGFWILDIIIVEFFERVMGDVKENFKSIGVPYVFQKSKIFAGKVWKWKSRSIE